jgi:hypothetical protein
MLHTITRREFSVTCDGCGAHGPAAESAKAACRLVRNLGWQGQTPLPHFDFLTTWLCPACQVHREAATSAN